MFTVFISLRYWLRCFFAFIVPFLFFTGLMQQTAVMINTTVENLNVRSKVAIVQSDTIHTLDLIMAQLEKKHELIRIEEVAAAQEKLMDSSVAIVLFATTDRTIKAIYNSEKNGLESQVILDEIAGYKQNYMIAQLDSLGINRQRVEPFELQEQDLANPMAMINRITDTIKANIANVLNILFILFVMWMIRIVLMVHQAKGTRNVGMAILSTWLGAVIVMGITFAGFWMGINIEEKGLIQGIVTNINSFVLWRNINSFVVLWIPTWFFVVALIGFLLNSTTVELQGYTRSFWAVVLLHIIAFVGTAPVTELSTIHCLIPIYNIFGIGQVALQETLDNTCWWVALASNVSFGVVFLGLWLMTNKYRVEQD